MGIKYSINENFFTKWSQEMAYTLGYIYADGSLENATSIRGKYIRISSSEKNNVLKIKKWLDSEHTIVSRSSTQSTRCYLLRIGNHKMYDDLVSLGLYPNKSLTIKFPSTPKKYASHFIRGYFDGDGCVRIWMSKGKRQEMILRKLCTVFTSGSKIFLQDLATCIHEMAGTNQRNVYNGNRSYMLSYSTGDSVKIFKLLYGDVVKPAYLERKALIYKKYFDLRPQRVDQKVQSILQYIDSSK